MTARTLTQIVEQAQRGDAESLGVLYDRYARDMAWLAYAIVLDRDLAEDIAQETFAVVCRKLSHLRKPERFPGWVAAICRHLAVDTLRGRPGPPVGLEAAEHVAGPQPEPDGHIVREAVACLPQMYREIVVLHYFNQMSYEQLCRTLDVSMHTVKGRLSRARKKLAQYLQDKDFEWGDL